MRFGRPSPQKAHARDIGSPPRGLGGIARTVRAPAAAVGPAAVRGAWGSMALEREGGALTVIKDNLSKRRENTSKRNPERSSFD